MDLERAKNVAVAAAYGAAKILQAHFGNISRIEKKGAIDLVTRADRESEQDIITTLQSAFPDHGILAEESGSQNPSSDWHWIIDPLDGTTNFAHQLPIYSISLALAAQEKVVLGLILDPVRGELFSAIINEGASLNGRPIRVSSIDSISESLLVTGFPYNISEVLEPVMTRYENCLRVSQGVRRLGSAALDLCYVACGRFEAFWEQNLKPWDTAAGALIAREAGARVTDFSDHPFVYTGDQILASNGQQIHRQMLSLLSIA